MKKKYDNRQCGDKMMYIMLISSLEIELCSLVVRYLLVELVFVWMLLA